MGKKGGGGRSYQKKDVKNTKTSSRNQHHAFSSDDMDDEIDAFHKQRDIVPLDIHDYADESDEDDELPLFDSKDIDNDDEEDDDDEDSDEEEDDDDDDDDEDDDDDVSVAKIKKQMKYLRAKSGGDEDELQDDEEDEEDNNFTIGGRKFSHGAENRNFELQSSDDEAPKEEEELALQMQREKAKSLTMEDYGLMDISEDKDNDKLIRDASDKGNREIKPIDRDITFKAEDLNALSKEEQMNVVYRSAPELVDWLSELNEAHKQLECKINPILIKVKKGEIVMEGGVRYFELKQLLLLSYCQAITFYLLLKSEGQPVYDHPVIARLEEIKELTDQIKELDAKLPVELEDILKGSGRLETVVKSDNQNAPMPADPITKNQEQPFVSAESPEEAVPNNIVEIQKLDSAKVGVQKGRKVKDQKDHIGVQSLEMLKVRASLEEKLKQKGLYSHAAPKPSNSLKRPRPANGQLETYDDFDDDVVDDKGPARLSNGLVSSRVSQYLNANLKKPKVVSGDDDLPGERRRKHEDRVMAGAGVRTEDDGDDDDDHQMGDLGSHEVAGEEEDLESGDSENEFYKQVEKLRAAKAETYSRKSADPSLPEDTLEGKRHITSQMEKNRGLTRRRNKDKKNPRKNYRDKHKKAVKNRKGQVQSIKKPTGPYGGESSGINATISRSIRFKG